MSLCRLFHGVDVVHQQSRFLLGHVKEDLEGRRCGHGAAQVLAELRHAGFQQLKMMTSEGWTRSVDIYRGVVLGY
jgi:hypothetical protein